MDIDQLIQTTLDPQKLVDTAIAEKYSILRNAIKGAIYVPEFENLVLQYMQANRKDEYEKVAKLNRVVELTRSSFGIE